MLQLIQGGVATEILNQPTPTDPTIIMLFLIFPFHFITKAYTSQDTIKPDHLAQPKMHTIHLSCYNYHFLNKTQNLI